jgi:coiled-coil domain-containing protein 12
VDTMASAHTTLDAAATERKARLAKLKSLKRKQPDGDTEADSAAHEDAPTVTTTYLSGRNYDPSTRGPKLGFETAPSEDQETLEIRAKEISETTQKLAEAEEKAEKPIDLFKLQPKKPNWDLKRDVQRKLERLNVQTDNAIARIVRERIETQRKKQVEAVNGSGSGEGETVGLQGEELVEGIHVREREEAEEERKGREEEEEEDYT